MEDVGRHNTADTIAGKMWLDRISGRNKIFYSTRPSHVRNRDESGVDGNYGDHLQGRHHIHGAESLPGSGDDNDRPD